MADVQDIQIVPLDDGNARLVVVFNGPDENMVFTIPGRVIRNSLKAQIDACIEHGFFITNDDIARNLSADGMEITSAMVEAVRTTMRDLGIKTV